MKKFDENGMAVATIATVTGRLHWLINGGHRARINASSAHELRVGVTKSNDPPNFGPPGRSVSKYSDPRSFCFDIE